MSSITGLPDRRAAQRGFSLIELMVSIVLGLVIIASLAMLFANSSRARQESDKTNQQIENGRYASQYLLQDLRLAGYFGEFNPGALGVPALEPDPSGTSVGSLTVALPIAVQGYHFGKNAATASAIEAGVTALLTDLRPNSDVLVLRRTSTCVAGHPGCDLMDTASRTYFQTTLCQSQLSTLAASATIAIGTTASVFTTSNPAVTTGAPTFLAQRDCATPAGTRSLLVRIYYVANNDNAGDGIPTLKMVELGAGAFSAPVPIAEGIETMQVEYGVDTNTDGAPEFYTPDPANQAYKFDAADANTVWPAATAYPGAPAAWHDVTAVKVHVLARNTLPSGGFTDSRVYVLGSAKASDNTFGPYNDAYKRHVYTTVVRLNNVAGRVE